MILIANNDVLCNHIIIQSFHHHEDALLALRALLVRNRGRSSVCLFVFSSVYPSPKNDSDSAGRGKKKDEEEGGTRRKLGRGGRTLTSGSCFHETKKQGP